MTASVTTTAATMTMLSLSLIDRQPVERVHGVRRDVVDLVGVVAPVVAERVADAVHGADDVVAELAAQGPHVGVDGAGARPVAVAPHLERAAARG